METTYRLLLALLGRALFEMPVTIPPETDWTALYREARSHYVHLLVYDCLTDEEVSRMPPKTALHWQMEAYASLTRNEQINHEQQTILKRFAEEHIPCLILKGSSSSMCYPRPELRHAGDIDLLIPPERLEEGIALLMGMGYDEPINYDHVIHRTMFKGELCAELHFRMPCIPETPLGERLEARCFFAPFDHCDFWNGLPVLPSDRQALLLLLHKLEHITSSGMGLRQLCDWAAFVHEKLDAALWAQLQPILEEFGVMHFARIITRMCVEHLALPAADAPWCMQANKDLMQELLDDILRTGNFGCKENRYGQRLFTDGQGGGRLGSFVRNAVKTSYMHWPISEKCPILLPLAPIPLLLRYRRQRKEGVRPPFRPLHIYRTAKARQALYHSLQAFTPTEEHE